MNINHRSNNFFPAVTLLAAAALWGAFAGCAGSVRQCPRPIEKPDLPQHELPEFEHEGFINTSTYRVIIIEPLGLPAPQSMKDLEASARSRTLSSLQKYLLSQGRQVNAGARTRLLNLVNQHGALRLIEKNNPSRRVYYFEVKMDNLRQHLSDCCEIR